MLEALAEIATSFGVSDGSEQVCEQPLHHFFSAGGLEAFHADSHPQPRALSVRFSRINSEQEQPGPASQLDAGQAGSTKHSQGSPGFLGLVQHIRPR